MGLVTKLLELRSTLATPSRWLLDAWSGQTTASGASVSQTTALRHPAVYRAVSLIAGTVGQLPLKVYRRLPNDDKVAEPGHRLYSMLHDSPNREMTAQDFREALQADLCLYGNAFAQILRDNQGRVTSLWPLAAASMEITRNAALELVYQYQTTDGRFEFIHSAIRPEILHLRSFSEDGIVGRSPIQVAREAIGGALSADEYGFRFFGNGAAPMGVLTGPKGARLTEQAHQRLKNSWNAAHGGGVANSHKVALLEDGWQWSPISVANRDSQWLEARQHGVLDVARIFGVPPWMLFDMEKSANYSNVEQQGIDWLREVGGWLRRWEMQINKDLLSARSSRTHFVKFTIEGLLRGDIQTRYQAYATGRQWGWLSINDVRRLEDMNSIGDVGNEYQTPLNMAPAGEPDPDTPEPMSDRQAARLMEIVTGGKVN
jgi:HK97 family phage portal protein